MNPLNIKQDLIIPFIPRWTIIIATSVIAYNRALQFLSESNIIGIVLMVFLMFAVLFFLFTSRHQIEIDFKNRTIHPHIWIGGYKIGKRRTFTGIEKIFVNQVNQSQKLYTPYNYSTKYFGRLYIEESVYTSFLKFDTGEKILLLVNRNRDQLFNQLRQFENLMDVKIYDNTNY